MTIRAIRAAQDNLELEARRALEAEAERLEQERVRHAEGVKLKTARFLLDRARARAAGDRTGTSSHLSRLLLTPSRIELETETQQQQQQQQQSVGATPAAPARGVDQSQTQSKTQSKTQSFAPHAHTQARSQQDQSSKALNARLLLAQSQLKGSFVSKALKQFAIRHGT